MSDLDTLSAQREPHEVRRHSALFERWRRLMDDWMDYLNGRRQ